MCLVHIYVNVPYFFPLNRCVELVVTDQSLVLSSLEVARIFSASAEKYQHLYDIISPSY